MWLELACEGGQGRWRSILTEEKPSAGYKVNSSIKQETSLVLRGLAPLSLYRLVSRCDLLSGFGRGRECTLNVMNQGHCMYIPKYFVPALT